jgi:hypothetical protein
MDEMRNCIKTNHILILTLACLLSFAGLAGAEDTAVERALEICKPEIESYCSQVTPGEGRLLACFVAHEDKLSGQCDWALYEAMDELEAFINAVGYLAESCWDDMEEHCGEVELGEGRVAECLLDHKGEVSPACKEAMDDVELEVIEE